MNLLYSPIISFITFGNYVTLLYIPLYGMVSFIGNNLKSKSSNHTHNQSAIELWSIHNCFPYIWWF